MNRMQNQAIERFRRSVNDWCGKRYVVKTWDVDEIGINGVLSLVVVTGLPDTNVIQDHAHIFIGPRGGITYPVIRKGHFIERHLYGGTFLHVVVEQNADSTKKEGKKHDKTKV